MLYCTTGFQSKADPSLASWDLLVPATLQGLYSPRGSVGDGCLSLQLGLGDGNPAWLIPALTPHPSADLIQPAAVASPIPAVSHCSWAVAKTVLKGWSPVSLHKAWRQWHPAESIPGNPSQANV